MKLSGAILVVLFTICMCNNDVQSKTVARSRNIFADVQHSLSRRSPDDDKHGRGGHYGITCEHVDCDDKCDDEDDFEHGDDDAIVCNKCCNICSHVDCYDKCDDEDDFEHGDDDAPLCNKCCKHVKPSTYKPITYKPITYKPTPKQRYPVHGGHGGAHGGGNKGGDGSGYGPDHKPSTYKPSTYKPTPKPTYPVQGGHGGAYGGSNNGGHGGSYGQDCGYVNCNDKCDDEDDWSHDDDDSIVCNKCCPKPKGGSYGGK